MSEQLSCPVCGESTAGPFCSHCGARVAGPVICSSCGQELPAGGRFCNQCGTPAGLPAMAVAGAAATAPAAPTQRAASTLPWVISGLALLALVLALVFPRPDSSGGPVATPAPTSAPMGAGGAGSFGDATSVDLSSMSPREQADNLFNRVMQSVSAGDTTQVAFFLPMALSAYEAVPDLDADGYYHVAVLNAAAGNAAAARSNADSILALAPGHLFGLFMAGQAEQSLGNGAAARDFYQQFSDRFDEELASGRVEYSEHQAVMPMMQEEVRRALSTP